MQNAIFPSLEHDCADSRQAVVPCRQHNQQGCQPGALQLLGSTNVSREEHILKSDILVQHSAKLQHVIHTCINTDVYVKFERLCVFRVKGPDTNENGWSR